MARPNQVFPPIPSTQRFPLVGAPVIRRRATPPRHRRCHHPIHHQRECFFRLQCPNPCPSWSRWCRQRPRAWQGCRRCCQVRSLAVWDRDRPASDRYPQVLHRQHRQVRAPETAFRCCDIQRPRATTHVAPGSALRARTRECWSDLLGRSQPVPAHPGRTCLCRVDGSRGCWHLFVRPAQILHAKTESGKIPRAHERDGNK